MTDTPARVQALLEELSRDVESYESAKQEIERARVHYEIARERFSRIRTLAASMLSAGDWQSWLRKHPNLKYIGSQIGDAISTLLTHRAFESAHNVGEGKDKKYRPAATMEMIASELEIGGFEFRSTSPFREVNAALIKLTGVKKNTAGLYMTEESHEILNYYISDEDYDQKQKAAASKKS